MSQTFNPLHAALGLGLAITIGFLVGRTPERDVARGPRPGIRDFIIIALLGGICAILQEIALTVTIAAGVIVVVAVARFQHPERMGITTELAALATFVLGYFLSTPQRVFAAGVGIVLAGLLTAREEVRHLALETISENEYADTLIFLALIFLVFPLLPAGSYGPFKFFNPRQIWVFVILVSGVSFVGYFLQKFTDPESGMTLTAIFGALASTTAYTGGVARLAAESPASAVMLARAALIANSFIVVRVVVIVAAISPQLALDSLPSMAAILVAGLAAAWLLCREARTAQDAGGIAAFRNPLTLWPAVQFGLIFTAVLFATRAAKHYYGDRGQMAGSAIGGLVDVVAVTLSLCDFYNSGISSSRDAIIGIVIALFANALFKSALAQTSRQPRFYLRLMAGFAVQFAATAIVLLIPALAP